MRKIKNAFSFPYLLTYSLMFTISVYPQVQQKFITAKAIWNPDMTTMEKITENCGSLSGKDLGNCFVQVMKNSGASEQAIEFTSLMNNDAYMNGFKHLGSVDAAFVYYPLQGSDRYGCVIVNGSPLIINVDDYNLLPMDTLEQIESYKELASSYQHIELFPGDRKNPDYPYDIKLKGKVNRIVVNYRLRNGCNTCDLLGFVEFGFDFDSTGKFINCKFLSLRKTVNTQTQTTNYNTNYYSDPSQPIDLSKGDKFSIVLVSNHAEGFKWQLSKKLDKKILSLSGTNFIRPYETLPTAPGKEIWYFNAVGNGSTEISFNYVSSWNKGSKIYEKHTFTVNVR